MTMQNQTDPIAPGADLERLPGPVATADLLNGIVLAIRRHVVLSPAEVDAVAMWIAHTWVFNRFEHTPRLSITGPAKQCGKSTLVDVLTMLCRQPVKADNISVASVFRLIAARLPTLLIDEADACLREKEELRGVLNSGFEQSGAVVRVGDQKSGFEPQQFSTFAPVALAGIGKLPGTIEDRAVPVLLKRKSEGEKVEKLRAPGARAALRDLASMAERWASDRGALLSTAPDIPDVMGDREGDISVPLLAIADDAGGDWPARARASLLAVFHHRAATEGNSEDTIKLLSDIRVLFLATSSLQMSSKQIVDHLIEQEDRPWGECRNGKPMTAAQLAHLLAPFGVRPSTIRIGTGPKDTIKGYRRDSFEETWDRYLPKTSFGSHPVGGAEPSHRHNACGTGGAHGTGPSHGASQDPAYHRLVPTNAQFDVAARVTAAASANVAEDQGCDGVTAGSAPGGDEERDPWDADVEPDDETIIL